MPRSLLALALLLLIVTPVALADQDRASFSSDITVSEGDVAGNVACAFCSVYVHGEVRGNVAVFFGNIKVDSSRGIAGNVAMLGGDLDLASDAQVGGNVAIAGGNTNLAPTAEIHGNRAVLPGRLWALIPFAPLLILIGIIWLIVYLVRRNRYQFPVYPNGRGL
ncbi:MAG: hypothetical protein BGO25_11605 [Acidobacteriales bacterium 59-55]|nr:hypothetical protein [Terriglobales bacterium]OJV43796.1 MAG: hypothetical protein BGO25_11605 [Acidobacteriales bacterium 59-55]